MLTTKRKQPTVQDIKKMIGDNYDFFVALVTGDANNAQPSVIPKYTTGQRDALVTADIVVPLLIFNSTTNLFNFYDGTQWVEIPSRRQLVLSAINVTATATTGQVLGRVITSTSAAAVSVTLPTATALATALGATRGTRIQFVIDNSAGANTVTVVVGAGITVNTPAITGGAALTVSTANAVGIFELYFTGTTTAKIFRIA